MTERGRWYVDLVVVTIATAVCAAGIATGVDGIPRILLAAPLVLFLPGYAVTAALFPENASARHALTPFDEPKGSRLGAMDELSGGAALGAEGRIALSVLGSIAVVSMVSFAANFVGPGIRLDPVLVGVVAVTALGLAAAAVGRLRLNPADRFAVGIGLPRVLFTAERNRVRDAAVPNVLLIVGILVLTAGVGYAAVAEPRSEQFTEFYVETEEMTFDSQGIYPDTFTRGESSPLSVHVGNHEGSRTDYTVVAVLQRVDGGANTSGPTRVVDRQRLATQDVSVRDETTKQIGVTVTPEMAGEDLRVVLFLYRGPVPEVPSRTTAYRTVSMQVTVS